MKRHVYFHRPSVRLTIYLVNHKPFLLAYLNFYLVKFKYPVYNLIYK